MAYELILYILFPLLLILSLSIFYIFYSPSFKEIGIGKRELGLLFIGSLSTMFINMPIFIYKKYFLAINIGGALIPLVLSYYFIATNGLHFPKMLAGISIVSIATFMVTKVTSQGVISYFPFYLFPSILAFLISMLFYFRSPIASSYSYATATIGVIIGGDFSHLPEIFHHPFMGSIGGAGLYDMVYMAGILSFLLSFTFSKKKRRDKKEAIIQTLKEYAIVAKKFGKGDDLIKKIDEIRLYSGRHFRKEANKLYKKIGFMLRTCYAGEDERIYAFLIDMPIIFALSIIASLLKLFGGFFQSFVISFTVFQLFYFFLMEYFFNATIGKAFFGIEVRKENFEKIDFMDAFTRNVIRFFDMLAFFYILSLILMGVTPMKQRMGDLIAGTIVARSKCLK